MILTFSETKFEKGIIAGTKRTSLREDRQCRWKVGRLIHFWLHNPRNTRLNPRCFGIGKVISIEKVSLYFNEDIILIEIKNSEKMKVILIDKKLNEFANRDGFESWEEMKEWFLKKYKRPVFHGKLIWFEVNTILL